MRRTLTVALASLTTLVASAALAQDGPPPGPPRQMPNPEDVFKRWDTNGDGAVDKAEWDATGRPADRFAMLDDNKHGKVNIDEMKTAFENIWISGQDPKRALSYVDRRIQPKLTRYLADLRQRVASN